MASGDLHPAFPWRFPPGGNLAPNVTYAIAQAIRGVAFACQGAFGPASPPSVAPCRGSARKPGRVLQPPTRGTQHPSGNASGGKLARS
eukprot:15576-Pyramimonas_sp.AAC.1